MNETESRSDPQSPARSRLLLGWLMIILAPLFAYMVSLDEEGGSLLWGIPLSPTLFKVVGWGMGLLLLWSGGVMVRGYYKKSKRAE